jgi:hypothetical protein
MGLSAVTTQTSEEIKTRINVALCGVVEDSSGLRDRGPGFKTRSRPLTFTKAVTEFHNPTRCGVLIALTNSVEFRHAKDVKTL